MSNWKSEQRPVIAYETWYVCRICGYAAPRRLQSHMSTHAPESRPLGVDHRDLPGTVSVSFFATEDDMRLADPGTDRGDPQWLGSGYYAFWAVTGSCGRGCCEKEYYEAEPLLEFRERLTSEEREDLKQIIIQLHADQRRSRRAPRPT